MEVLKKLISTNIVSIEALLKRTYGFTYKVT